MYQVLLFIFSLFLTAECAPRCPKRYKPLHDRLCYRIGDRPLGWVDANRACIRDDGNLAVVRSQSDLDDLRQIVPRAKQQATTAYIGLIDRGDGSGFANADRSSVLATFWKGSTPRPQKFEDPRCAVVEMTREGRWISGQCGVLRKFICTYIPLDVRKRNAKPKQIRCHVCRNARTNEECNAQGTELCPPNAGSCQNEVRQTNGKRLISKQCKQTRACENNYVQNRLAMWLEAQCTPGGRGSSVCRCCCQGSECNAHELPCLAKGCPPLKVPLDGEVECSDEYRMGSLCKFSCIIGYSITGGSLATRCVGNGTWSSTPPECKRTKCLPDMKAPENGDVTCTSSEDQFQRCRFTCKPSYYVRGLPLTTCLPNGKWSVSAPTCVLIKCPTLKSPRNGRFVIQEEPIFGATNSFACDEKYFLVGRPSTRCYDYNKDGTGEWTASVPKCRLITCSPALANPTNGRVVLTDRNRLGSVGSFECEQGYYLKGKPTVTCEGPTEDGFGKWSSKSPTCEIIKCPEMPPLINGQPIISSEPIPIYGTILIFKCDHGYHMVGSSKLECVDRDGDGAGDWSEKAPTCKQILCSPNLSAPANGRLVTNGGSALGAVSMFVCNEGYFLDGQAKVTCLDRNNDGTGEWSAESPTCQLIECLPNLEAPENGDVFCTEDNEYGSKCMFLCEFGYFLSGSDSAVCQDIDTNSIGEWSHPSPKCIQIVCEPPLEAPKNGQVVCSNSMFYNSQCTFACNEGYRPEDDRTSTCKNRDTSVGEWTKKPPICKEIECLQKPNSPKFGRISCSDGLKYDSTCTYSCIDGYQLIGESTATCQDSDNDGLGEWDNKTPPACKRSRCSPNLAKVKLGTVDCTDSNGYGSSCTIRCNPGHKLIGNSTIICGKPQEADRATWSAAPSTCEERLCDDVTNFPRGSVTCTDGNAFGSVCTYSCDEDNFHLAGQAVRKCIAVSEESGSEVRWNSSLPTCTAIICDKIAPNSKRLSVKCTDDKLAVGTICVFECEDGYFVIGDGDSECMASKDKSKGQWSGTVPRCENMVCEPASVNPINGTVACTNSNIFQSVCTYSCAPGYQVIGKSVRECAEDGQWSELEPFCETKTCGDRLSAPENGNIFCTKANTYGSVCRFHCDIGYEIVGESLSTCGPAGNTRDGVARFNNLPPVCKAIYCPMIAGSVNGGKVVCGINQGEVESNRHDTMCYLSCNDGWRANGEVRTQCRSSGKWVKPLGKCERVKCDPLQKPSRGRFSCSKNDYTAGTSCTFACNPPLRLAGNEILTCTDEGAWSGELPTCVT